MEKGRNIAFLHAAFMLEILITLYGKHKSWAPWALKLYFLNKYQKLALVPNCFLIGTKPKHRRITADSSTNLPRPPPSRTLNPWTSLKSQTAKTGSYSG